MVRISWTDQAKNDLRDIYDYISKDSKKYAKHQVIRIQVKTKLLKKSPKAGRVIPEIEDHNYRELIEGSYRIIYKILSDTAIDIIVIHHSARDLKRRRIE